MMRIRCSVLAAAFITLPVHAFAQSDAIPAGTTIAVKTVDRVDSQSSQSGQTFRASLDEALVINGTTVAPAGNDAVLKVVEVKKAGKFAGKAELSITLSALKIGDKMVDLNTEYSTSASAGKGKGTAIKTGAGAAIGAAAGGIFGGGKGAAIGAGVGGAGGAGVATMTGPKVVIPSETRLSFITR